MYCGGLGVRKARSSPSIIFEVTSGKAGKYFKSFSSFPRGEYPAPAYTSDLWTLEEECVWKHLEKYVNISLKVFLWNKCHNYFLFCGRTNIYLAPSKNVLLSVIYPNMKEVCFLFFAFLPLKWTFSLYGLDLLIYHSFIGTCAFQLRKYVLRCVEGSPSLCLCSLSLMCLI